MKGPQDRRLSKRIPFRRKIKCGLCDPTFTGYTFDLSENGIGIKVKKMFPPKSVIVGDIYIGKKVVRVEGTVKWESSRLHDSSYKMGINFTGNKDKIRELYKVIKPVLSTFPDYSKTVG